MRVLTLILMIFFSGQSLAHQDTWIEMSKGGELIGLPLEYKPALFDVEKPMLQIAKNKLRIPECIAKYIAKNEVVFSGSWYHEGVDLPPYLNIKAIGYDETDEYTFVFNLNTLELIKAYYWAKEIRAMGVVYVRKKIELSPDCLKSFKPSAVD